MQKTSAEAAGALAREPLNVDICVIGAGSGGLSVAAGAAAFGQRVVLIEKGKMGGDCLNFGCVPSKALLAAGRRAEHMRRAAAFGIASVEPKIDFAAVHDHVHGVIDAIAPNNSVERFSGLGVRVITAAGRFVDRETVQAGEYRVKARRFVIATGSSPVVPPIAGLQDVAYFTNETIFENTRALPHLLIIGGGPIGLELAQAHRRLGSQVTVIEGAKALSREDFEVASVVLDQLRGEGITLHEGAVVERVTSHAGGIALTLKSQTGSETIEGTHLLIATGRSPNTADLGLDVGGIAFDKKGISVNAGLRTSNRRVYAIGDVVGGAQFTHVANDHAGIVLRRILFRLPAKVTGHAVPRVTFTDPELAHVGLEEDAARKTHGKVNVLRWSFHENDRAQAERETSGHIKVVTSPRGQILGVSIVGAHAGEIIQMWSLAIAQKLNIKAMTTWISPYPTLSEVNKRAAIRYYASAPGNPLVRKVISWLAKFG